MLWFSSTDFDAKRCAYFIWSGWMRCKASNLHLHHPTYAQKLAWPNQNAQERSFERIGQKQLFEWIGQEQKEHPQLKCNSECGTVIGSHQLDLSPPVFRYGGGAISTVVHSISASRNSVCDSIESATDRHFPFVQKIVQNGRVDLRIGGFFSLNSSVPSCNLMSVKVLLTDTVICLPGNCGNHWFCRIHTILHHLHNSTTFRSPRTMSWPVLLLPVPPRPTSFFTVYDDLGRSPPPAYYLFISVLVNVEWKIRLEFHTLPTSLYPTTASAPASTPKTSTSLASTSLDSSTVLPQSPPPQHIVLSPSDAPNDLNLRPAFSPSSTAILITLSHGIRTTSPFIGQFHLNLWNYLTAWWTLTCFPAKCRYFHPAICSLYLKLIGDDFCVVNLINIWSACLESGHHPSCPNLVSHHWIGYPIDVMPRNAKWTRNIEHFISSKWRCSWWNWSFNKLSLNARVCSILWALVAQPLSLMHNYQHSQ